jgi:hypothetical protein
MESNVTIEDAQSSPESANLQPVIPSTAVELEPASAAPSEHTERGERPLESANAPPENDAASAAPANPEQNENAERDERKRAAVREADEAPLKSRPRLEGELRSREQE